MPGPSLRRAGSGGLKASHTRRDDRILMAGQRSCQLLFLRRNFFGSMAQKAAKKTEETPCIA